MKKIGILTYQNAINYGAALQSKALYYYLSNKYPMYKFEIINYNNSKNPKNKSFASIIKSEKLNMKQKIKQLLGFCITLKSIKKFKKYSKDIIYSKKYDENTIQDIENEYDYFIIGSDQVWNYKLNGNDNTYFLPFIKNKNRIYTYASSIGLSKIDEEHAQFFIEHVANYNSVSVRENEAKDIINRIVDKEITVVLDPVFLVDMDYWKEITNKAMIKNNKYVTYYVFNPEYVAIANGIAQKYIDEGYLICKMNGKISIKDYISQKVIVGKSFGPEEFVQYIYNSDIVLTDSFHCVAMSIVFHKRFIVFLNDSVMETNSRMRNLLKICNLECLIYSKNMNYEEIDWELVDKKLDKAREKSKDYLANFDFLKIKK